MSVTTPSVPAGFARNARHDALAGFLVFLIALPLCLGIALASGYPPIAGVYTAVVGGVVGPLISNSELTIKGPSAALIVIAAAAVIELGGGGTIHALADLSSAQQAAGYRLALAAGAAAAVLQILFGLFRLGRLAEFFPTTAVQGFLASVGIIIFAKQIYVVLGVPGKKGDVFRLLADLPGTLLYPSASGVNPQVALIGGVGLLLLFGLPLVGGRLARRFPAPLAVLLVAVPLALWFDLAHEHDYVFNGHEYHVDGQYLVSLPDSFVTGFTLPDFSALRTFAGWKYVALFAVVGSLVSLLPAKAVDLLDPWRRKTDLDRDLLAVGVANTCSALLGGLPAISEIVRSKASIDNGARTRWANAFHSLFLLASVALLPGLLQHIPLAALAAMLVYTGCRLATPRGLLNAYRIGVDQLVIFVSTVLAGLWTDLLTGIAAGTAVNLVFNLAHGAPPRGLFRADVELRQRGERDFEVAVRHAAVFSNWLGLKRRLEDLGAGVDVTLDLSATRLVDDTVMERLHELEREFQRRARRLHVTGLDGHRAFSAHPHASRAKRAPAPAPTDAPAM